MGKIFIITGKGGVGKTSVAAAHAVRSADEGINTLLISADMAHNLGDIFQVEAGGSVKQIAPCLSLLELDPYLLMKEEYPDVNKALANLSGSSGAALSEVADSYMIPGFENLFSLLKIRDLYRSGPQAPGAPLLVCGKILPGRPHDHPDPDTGRKAPVPHGPAGWQSHG